MGLVGLMRLAAIKAGNRIGLYTKQQAVEAATNVGKELVDLRKSGTPITGEVIQTAIKKQVPHANVKIITDRDELIKVLENAGEDASSYESAISQTAASYFNSGRAKGIYAPKIDNTAYAVVIAHELEHYLYNEHTPKRKLAIFIIRKVQNIVKKLKPQNLKQENKKAYSQIKDEMDIQSSIWQLFGAEKLAQSLKPFKGVKPTADGISEFLKGKYFTGLTDDKRIDAYIRTICRHYAHPQNKDSAKKIIFLKSTFDDEARAYGVTDEIFRYITGSKDVGVSGFIAEIYKRAGRILYDELLPAVNAAGESKITKQIKTGLPTTAFKNEGLVTIKLVNPTQ